MERTTVTRRPMQRDPRYAIPLAVDGTVEFNFPNPAGRKLEFGLVEISISGLSFAADRELPLVVRGAKVSGLRVRVGDIEIEGRLLVRHATGEAGGEVVYGGVFYPESGQDQRMLNRVITALTARP